MFFIDVSIWNHLVVTVTKVTLKEVTVALVTVTVISVTVVTVKDVIFIYEMLVVALKFLKKCEIRENLCS